MTPIGTFPDPKTVITSNQKIIIMRPELRDYITESNKAVKEIENKGFLFQGWNMDRDQVCCFKNGQYFYADNAISLLESLK